MTFSNIFRKSFTKIIILLGCWMVLLSSCRSQTPALPSAPEASNTPMLLESPTPTMQFTQKPSATPTLPPLGNDGNPITIGFMLSSEERNPLEAAEDIAFMIATDTGFAVESLIYPDFQSFSTAILNGDVDLFWLDPFEYIYLNWEGASQVLLVTNHLGVYAYGVRFMAHTERGFTSYYNSDTNQSVGDPIQALQQFAGTRPCFLRPNSIPGYYVPLGLLTKASTPVREPVFTYTYSGIVRALYVQGICDFGVGYALKGDPRTAGNIIQDLPDIKDQVKIIWQTEGIIPNLNLSAAPDLSLHLRQRLQESFLDLSSKEEGLTLLSTALNYDVEALKIVTDQFYNPLRDAIIPLEPDLLNMILSAINP